MRPEWQTHPAPRTHALTHFPMARHLIHIGWPKAGSSFLQEWFARHPELHYVPSGLAGFRNTLEVARLLDERYRYYVTSEEQLASPPPSPAGESVVQRQDAVCAFLRDVFPNSRVLIITRGFRSLVRSGHSQLVRMGLTQSIEAFHQSFRGRPATDEHRHYHFDRVIAIYREAFGAENVIVLPFELLRDDEAKFLATLEDRLGLEHREIRIGRVNESLTPQELYWYPMISRAVSGTASVLGERARGVIWRRYMSLTLRNRLRPLVRVLARIRPGRGVTEADFPPHYALHCAGNADSLRDDPLYAPYAADYLWTEESRRPRR